MNKLTGLTIALGAFTLAACGGGGGSGTVTINEPTPEPPVVTPDPTPEPPVVTPDPSFTFGDGTTITNNGTGMVDTT